MNIRQAKQTLFDSLVTNKNGTPIPALKRHIQKIYLNPPKPGDLTKQAMVIATREVTPFFVGIDVAVFISATENVQRSAEKLDEILEIIEENNLISSEYGPSAWTVAYDDANTAWVATSELEWGREDI